MRTSRVTNRMLILETDMSSNPSSTTYQLYLMGKFLNLSILQFASSIN